MMRVARTCTEIKSLGSSAEHHEPKRLSEYCSAPAYVLLGDPGSGKTTAFHSECERLGTDAHFISARDFLLYASMPDEWVGKILFIDGIDEVRAGTKDARIPFDTIRKRLLMFGKPRFRISCRQADWRGDNDRNSLKHVSPDSTLLVLQLERLSISDVKTILKSIPEMDDSESFIETANERGLNSFLHNPQSLVLLSKAVERGAEWPSSRKETFDLACETMALEHNDEHRLATLPSTSIQPLLDCAGRLCSVQLLSDKVGYSLDIDSKQTAYISLNSYDDSMFEKCSNALSSKLFKADSERQFSPVHRQVAEFLGAKHLMQLIDQGLSTERVLALMKGSDGTIVTPLRGLSAWLATLQPLVRRSLIENDPFGVAFYGDIEGFCADDQNALLAALMRNPDHPRNLSWAFSNVTLLSSLVGTATEAQIRQILDSRHRDQYNEAQLELMLFILCQGKQIPSLASDLLEIVSQSSVPQRVRLSALDAFVMRKESRQSVTRELETLLARIDAGKIPDPDGGLRGMILTELYPKSVRPRNVWGYADLGIIGTGPVDYFYKQFWKKYLIEQSSEDDIQELIDSLVAELSTLESALEQPHFRELPLILLHHALQFHGDRVDIGRLHRWLGVSIKSAERFIGARSHALQGIRTWLEQRPETQKAIISMGIETTKDDVRVSYYDHRNRRRLFDSKLPPDFGLWCLEQAMSMAATRPYAAKYLFRQAYVALKTGNWDSGLSWEILKEKACRHDLLSKFLDELIAPIPPRADELISGQEQRNRTDIYEKEQQKWVDWIRSNVSELFDNRGVPPMLYQLAQLYFGELIGIDDNGTGRSAISRTFTDTYLSDAVMYGLRRTVDRDDLPTFEHVIRLHRNCREHYLGLPLLVSLEISDSQSCEALTNMGDERIRTCIACYHYYAPSLWTSERHMPRWYASLLRGRPELVSEVAVQCAVASLRSGQVISPRFWDLSVEGIPVSIIRGTALKLLQAIPLRLTESILQVLDQLLWIGIRHGAQGEILQLVRTKLSRRSLSVGQRVHWLAAGLIVSEGEYRDVLSDTLDRSDRLVRHLTAFYRGPYDYDQQQTWEILDQHLDDKDLGVLIAQIGRHYCRSYRNSIDNSIDSIDGIHTYMFVDAAIERLANRPDGSASEVLDLLVKDKRLVDWKSRLAAATRTQHVLRRDAEFDYPTVAGVYETLMDGRPVNSGDLTALMVDRIRQFGRKIRSVDSNDWQQFWNEGDPGKVSKPKSEESCRDVLLSHLRLLIPDSVTAQPEWRHSNRARSDIEVSYQKFHIPIEIKKNDHRDLWTAMQHQLISKYTLDIGTNGYGIYLVLWFGKERQRRRHDGISPDSHKELQVLLEQSLDREHLNKIKVCVIDVSRMES